MAKYESNGFYAGGLTAIAGCTTLTVCAGQPTTIADITTKKLASVAVSSDDFAIANGDTSGRKITVAQKSAIAITTSGTADHVVIDNGTDFLVTTATAQALTSGGTVTVPSWKLEIQAPA